MAISNDEMPLPRIPRRPRRRTLSLPNPVQHIPHEPVNIPFSQLLPDPTIIEARNIRELSAEVESGNVPDTNVRKRGHT
jgi:hypothetical protein